MDKIIYFLLYILWLIFGREFDGRSFIESGKFMGQEKGWLEIFLTLRRKTGILYHRVTKQNS